MPGLSKDVINKLLAGDNKTKTPPGTNDKTYKERWPGEQNLIKLSQAVKRRADYVVFRNGDRFNIKYVSNDTILIKPDFPKFVPMGFFSITRLKDVEISAIDVEALAK